MHRIILRDQRIRFRVPCAVVHSIQDADQAVAAIADHALKPRAEFRCLDFLRVAAAHRRQIVREDQSALQEIHLAIKFQRIHGEERFRQADRAHRRSREQALIAEVVDRQDYRQRANHRIARMLRAQQHRYQRGLPVVAMHHVRQPHPFHHLDRYARKLREAFCVVDVVAVLVAVELRTIEIRRIVRHEISDALHRRGLDDGGKPHPVAQRRAHARNQHGPDFISVIARQQNRHLMSQRGQGTRQPFNHVRKPTGLRVGEPFRGYEQYFHGISAGRSTLANASAPVKPASASGPEIVTAIGPTRALLHSSTYGATTTGPAFSGRIGLAEKNLLNPPGWPRRRLD